MQNKAVDHLQLVALQHSLPGKILMAARAVAEAEQRLAEVLTLRAAGQTPKRSEIAVARMTLDRAMRDAEDLQRIQAALPAMLARQAPAVRLAM